MSDDATTPAMTALDVLSRMRRHEKELAAEASALEQRHAIGVAVYNAKRATLMEQWAALSNELDRIERELEAAAKVTP